MKHVKKFMAILLSLVLALVAFPVMALAKENMASGSDWSLTQSGKLTIVSDNGLGDWNANGKSTYKDNVISLEICDGVTSIPAVSFMGNANLTDVVISGTVTNIDISAFSGCSNLKSLTLNEGLKTLSETCFYRCYSLTAVTIPSTVNAIEPGVFQDCTALEKVIMKSSTPPSLTGYGFGPFSGSKFYTDNSKGIIVPDGTLAAYQQVWQLYRNYIRETSSETIDTSITAKATIPSPTYTVTIPATVDVGELVQKASDASDKIKSTPLTVSATSVNNLFGQKKVNVAVSTADGNFKLADGSNKLDYSVFSTATGGSALTSGATFAEFTAAGDNTGRIEIDQSTIDRAGNYTGTLTFTISLADIPA